MLLRDQAILATLIEGVLRHEILRQREMHDYELFLGVCGIEHTKTKVRHPQTSGISERFHKTILNEFYQVAFQLTLYTSLDFLQADLDIWIAEYNTKRMHQGEMCCGRTPMETMIDGKQL